MFHRSPFVTTTLPPSPVPAAYSALSYFVNNAFLSSCFPCSVPLRSIFGCGVFSFPSFFLKEREKQPLHKKKKARRRREGGGKKLSLATLSLSPFSSPTLRNGRDNSSSPGPQQLRASPARRRAARRRGQLGKAEGKEKKCRLRGCLFFSAVVGASAFFLRSLCPCSLFLSSILVAESMETLRFSAREKQQRRSSLQLRAARKRR